MKIVFVLPDMPGGGSERVVAMLANEFVKRDLNVSILLFAGSSVAYPLDPRIEVVIAGERSGGNPWLRIRRLVRMRQFYRRNRGCYISSFCVMGTVFSVLAATGIPHRMLVSERNDPTRIPHQKLRNWAYRKAERLVFQTQDMKECFDADIRKKSVVIPNPVPDNIPNPFLGERKKRIVSVGRLEPQKNHRLLIEAFSEFHREYTDYQLHLFGVGELENELRKQVERLNIDNSVIFRGFSSNVKEEIRDSAMFVLSSDYEGISNSMIEALSMGVPVISTDCPVGGSRVYIEDGVNGLLVPVGDGKALLEAMRRVAGDRPLSAKLSSNAAKVKEKYGLSEIADRFLEEAGI